MTFYQRRGKRALDIILSIVALPVLALSAAVAGPVIRRDGGPALYKSNRIGKDMAPFTMLKFRSMVFDAPDLRNPDGTTYNSPTDPRVTPIGSVIRRTSVDELPQIINVLRGEMSFVGPRPSPTGNRSRYDDVALKRFDVRPGITGLSQTRHRNNSSLEQRFNDDAEYAASVSLIGDLRILAKTFTRVYSRTGVHRNG